MNTKSRILSVQTAKALDSSITGLPIFELSDLNLPDELDFDIPTNIRLGHIAEKVVSELIKASTNFDVRYENIQLKEDKITIGEIDFIIEETITHRLIHLELAYKFYLYDPNLSTHPIENWIGPNRNDSLVEKLAKLKTKQFPLLHRNSTALALSDINISAVDQALCFLVSLFVPFGFSSGLNPNFEQAIKGHYLDFETFGKLDMPSKSYYIPSKKEWGMAPSQNKKWTDFAGIEQYIRQSLEEKQAPLCWQKEGDAYSEFFVVWW